MDQQSVREIIEATKWPRTAAAAALGMLAVFLFIAAVSELKSYRFIGSGVTATNIITVSGKGEVFAVPDTAEFSVTVQETAKDVSTAQDAAAKKANDIISYLKVQGIDEKDIKTTDYGVQPQYEWRQDACPGGYCPPSNQTLIGFQVSETLTVKVRNTQKAGELLSGVGQKGAFQVSGLSFTVADEDELQSEARGKAIDDAKQKADELADELGVSVVRIVGFSEDGNAPMPLYAARDMAAGMGVAKAVEAPELALGQNKITSNVSVTYEIR